MPRFVDDEVGLSGSGHSSEEEGGGSDCDSKGNAKGLVASDSQVEREAAEARAAENAARREEKRLETLRKSKEREIARVIMSQEGGDEVSGAVAGAGAAAAGSGGSPRRSPQRSGVADSRGGGEEGAHNSEERRGRGRSRSRSRERGSLGAQGSLPQAGAGVGGAGGLQQQSIQAFLLQELPSPGQQQQQHTPAPSGSQQLGQQQQQQQVVAGEAVYVQSTNDPTVRALKCSVCTRLADDCRGSYSATFGLPKLVYTCMWCLTPVCVDYDGQLTISGRPRLHGEVTLVSNLHYGDFAAGDKFIFVTCKRQQCIGYKNRAQLLAVSEKLVRGTEARARLHHNGGNGTSRTRPFGASIKFTGGVRITVPADGPNLPRLTFTQQMGEQQLSLNSISAVTRNDSHGSARLSAAVIAARKKAKRLAAEFHSAMMELAVIEGAGDAWKEWTSAFPLPIVPSPWGMLAFAPPLAPLAARAVHAAPRRFRRAGERAVGHRARGALGEALGAAVGGGEGHHRREGRGARGGVGGAEGGGGEDLLRQDHRDREEDRGPREGDARVEGARGVHGGGRASCVKRRPAGDSLGRGGAVVGEPNRCAALPWMPPSSSRRVVTPAAACTRGWATQLGRGG